MADNSNGNRNMEYLRIDEERFLAFSSYNRGGLTICRLTNDYPGHGRTGDHAQEDAALLSVQLRDFQGQLWRSGKPVATDMYGAGEFSVYDYRETWRADMKTSFDCLNVHLPYQFFQDLSPQLCGRFDGIKVGAGVSVNDSVVANIAGIFAEAVLLPQNTTRLFMDHLEHALAIHIGTSYGGLVERSGAVSKGGLTNRDLAKATELMEANLDGGISLEELALACGLSTGHFARAFKQSLGIPPHRWFLHRRVEHAKNYLIHSKLTLSEIAIVCGFADQAHLTRVFRAITGLTPRAWRTNSHS